MSRIMRLSTLVALVLAIGSGTLLFRVSQHVQSKETELQSIKQAIAREEESIRVLKAEWVYLNQPERLEKLADKYLDLQSPQVKRLKYQGEEVPEPFYPALPKSKPSLTPQPASLSVSHSLSEASSQKTEPVTKKLREDINFNELMEEKR